MPEGVYEGGHRCATAPLSAQCLQGCGTDWILTLSKCYHSGIVIRINRSVNTQPVSCFYDAASSLLHMDSAYCSDDLAILSTLVDREMRVNIFVGNLSFTSTDQELRQLFEQYGVVDQVNLITDRETGRPRGFGFVEMPDAQAAKAAITALQGKDLGGRPLTVNEAKPREPRREPRRPRW